MICQIRITTLIPAMLAALFLQATGAVASEGSPAGPEVAADALHHAISSGNEEQIRALLDPEVLIFESGGVESSLEEYAGHHMGADMKFMAGMDRELLERQTFESEGLAAVTTHSRLSGTYNDKTLALVSTETLVLRHTDDGWKVRHIHWSSQRAE